MTPILPAPVDREKHSAVPNHRVVFRPGFRIEVKTPAPGPANLLDSPEIANRERHAVTLQRAELGVRHEERGLGHLAIVRRCAPLCGL
jgi:hypothetical protein